MIHSPSKPGINASNNLLNQRNLESYGFNELMREYAHDSTHVDEANSFLPNPSGNPDDAQLWFPQAQSQTLGDSFFVADLAGSSVIRALKSYYKRFNGSNAAIVLDSLEVQLAEQSWYEGNVYSSIIYRHKHRHTTRADNFVLFESGKPNR